MPEEVDVIIFKNVCEINSSHLKLWVICNLLIFFFFGVHPLLMTTPSSSTLKVGFAVTEEANA